MRYYHPKHGFVDSTEVCHLDETQYVHLLDHLEGIVKAVYMTGSVDDLESCLEECLAVCGLDIPSADPVIKGVDNV